MNLLRFAPRALILALMFTAAIVSLSCNEAGAGFGQTVPAGARWGGGSSGPGVFVGGPR
jgi:hypothetical protein